VSNSRHETVHRLFTAAVRLPPEDQPAYLDPACADDADLRAEVEAKLAEDARADGVFAAVADEGGARFLAVARKNGIVELFDTIRPLDDWTQREPHLAPGAATAAACRHPRSGRAASGVHR